MNIAFFGSSLLSAYWNGAATYYRGILRALAERGHRITFYEPDAYGRQQHRDMEPPLWAKVVVYANTEQAVLREVEAARHADLIVKASGVGVFDELLEAAVLAQQGPTRTVVYWDVDAPATLERLHRETSDPLAALVGRFDLVLTYGGGKPVIEDYLSLGARGCVPIYNGLDPDTHFPGEPDSRFVADLAFLGNRLPDRESRVQDFLIEPAQSLPEMRFVVGGSGWEQDELPGNLKHVGHVYTADHNAFNCSARAVLNINRASMARYGYSPATRLFEAAGAAACIISDDWEGIEEFFEPGFEILVASEGAVVASHIEALSDRRAQAIGRNAYRRACAEHTYGHRAAEFEALFEHGVPGRLNMGRSRQAIQSVYPPGVAL